MKVPKCHPSTTTPPDPKAQSDRATFRNRRSLGMARILMSMWRPSSSACHIESELTEPRETDREPRTRTASAIAGTNGKQVELEPHQVAKPSPHLSTR